MKTEVFEQFCRVCLPLLQSGFTASKASSLISRMGTVSPKVQSLARSLSYQMQTGCSFSFALERYVPEVASQGYGSLISVFEKNGNLEKALELYLYQKDASNQMKSRLAGALLYPALVVAALILLCLFLAMNSHLFGLESGALIIRQALLKGGFLLALWLSGFLMWLNRVFRVNQKEQFYRIMAAGIANGTTVSVCLKLSALSLRGLTTSLARTMQLVEQGVPLAQALQRQPQFCRDDLSLIEAATCSADLAQGFLRYAETLCSLQKTRQDRSLVLVEPVLLTGVGAVVLLVAKEAILPFLTTFGGVI